MLEQEDERDTCKKEKWRRSSCLSLQFARGGQSNTLGAHECDTETEQTIHTWLRMRRLLIAHDQASVQAFDGVAKNCDGAFGCSVLVPNRLSNAVVVLLCCSVMFLRL